MALDEQLKRELQSRSEQARIEVGKFEETKVHVAMIGEAGSGKSSLVNALVGSKVAEVGGWGEITQQAQEIPHADIDGLVFWDLPGCGYLTTRAKRTSTGRNFVVSTTSSSW